MTRIYEYRPACATEGFNDYKVARPETLLMVNQDNAATQSLIASVIIWKLFFRLLLHDSAILTAQEVSCSPGYWCTLGQWWRKHGSWPLDLVCKVSDIADQTTVVLRTGDLTLTMVRGQLHASANSGKKQVSVKSCGKTNNYTVRNVLEYLFSRYSEQDYAVCDPGRNITAKLRQKKRKFNGGCTYSQNCCLVKAMHSGTWHSKLPLKGNAWSPYLQKQGLL